MLEVYGNVDHGGSEKFGLGSPQVETNQCDGSLPVYHIRTHQQKQADQTETLTAYTGRKLLVWGSVLLLSVALVSSSNLPGKGSLNAGG